MSRLWLLVVLLWPAVTDAAGKKFYVMKTGNDTNPGTITQPFLTINRGIDSTRAGDTLFIGPGEYDTPYGSNYSYDYSYDAGTCYIRFGGTSDANRLVIRSMHDSTRPAICGHRGYYDRHAVLAANGIDYVTLDSLIVKQAVRGIYFNGNGWLIQSVVSCSTYIGLGPDEADVGSRIDNNAGIMACYEDPGSIWYLDNVVRGCTLYAHAGRLNAAETQPSFPTDLREDVNKNGILTYSIGEEGNRFTNNVIFDVFSGIRSKTGHAWGLRCDSNLIHDVSWAFEGFGFDSAQITFNEIHTTSDEAIYPNLRANSPNEYIVTGLLIANNTIYGNGAGGIVFGWDGSGGTVTQFCQCTVINNIVVADNGSNREFAILKQENVSCGGTMPSVAAIFEDFNCFYDPGNTQIIRWYNPSQQDWTLQQYRDNTTHGDNTLSIYPGFLDTTIAGGFDLRVDPENPVATGGMGGDHKVYMGAHDPNSEEPPTLSAPPPVKRKAP